VGHGLCGHGDGLGQKHHPESNVDHFQFSNGHDKWGVVKKKEMDKIEG